MFSLRAFIETLAEHGRRILRHTVKKKGGEHEAESLFGRHKLNKEAIIRAGWLHNPRFWRKPVENLDEQRHVFSLSDLELGDVIDKGCNAVVYAARWRSGLETIKSEQINQLSEEIPGPSTPNSESTKPNTMENESTYTCFKNLLELVKLPMEQHRSFSPILTAVMGESEDLYCGSRAGDEEPILSKKLNLMEPMEGDKKTPEKEFPLAVKMMFNYEAESNASAIMRAMYREIVPARTVQLGEAMSGWQQGFFGEKCHLPWHANIVEMPCVFVDSVPLLSDSLKLYPDALPVRLNPSGYGRNMSLFCVMKRYDMNLSEYLQTNSPPVRTSLLMLTQLLEAIHHLNSHNITHRDLKADNLLLQVYEGQEFPHLVVTDFGCCLGGGANLSVPFSSPHADTRQGNSALMAPEVKTAKPGFLQYVNYSLSDLWAVGCLAYEMFGQPNPFSVAQKQGNSFVALHETGGSGGLDSATYTDAQIPRLPKEIPSSIRNLIYDVLRRNPRQRPSTNVAANICQLQLWGPKKWLNRYAVSTPSQTEVTQWLLCVSTKVLCEAHLGGEGKSSPNGAHLEYQLISTFLSHVRFADLMQAIKWNRAF